MKSRKTMSKKRIGSILTAAGALFCIAAAGLVGYNFWDNSRAENSVNSVLQQISISVSEKGNDTAGADEMQEADGDPFRDKEMPTVEIDGYLYIGILEIPSLGLELPVMESWDYPRMKIAPCRYTGSVYRNDMIIAGHNYASHFGNLQNLQSGDEVLFTDMEGNSFSYAVSQTETLDGTAVEEMESGEWDLTLFTCTISGKARVTVRCKETGK